LRIKQNKNKNKKGRVETLVETQNNNNYDPAEKRARKLWLKTLCIRKLYSNNLAAY